MPRKLCPDCMESFPAEQMVQAGGRECCQGCADRLHGGGGGGVVGSTGPQGRGFSAMDALARMGGSPAPGAPRLSSLPPVEPATPERSAATPPPVQIGGGSSFVDYVGRIPESFAYPLRGSGIALILVGGLFLGALSLIAKYNAFPFIGTLFGVIGTGYLCAYMQKVIHATAMGQERLPNWPGFSNFQDSILLPMFQFVAPFLVVLAPAVVVAMLMDWYLGVQWYLNPVFYALALLGLLYVPMSLLTITIFGSITHMRPSLVLRSIWRVPASYAVLCAILLVTNIAFRVAMVLLIAILPVSVFFLEIVNLYVVVVQMRLIGFLFYDHQEELGWFSQ